MYKNAGFTKGWEVAKALEEGKGAIAYALINLM